MECPCTEMLYLIFQDRCFITVSSLTFTIPILIKWHKAKISIRGGNVIPDKA